MRKLVRVVGIFVLLYAAAAGVVAIGLPRLISWQFATCMHDPHPPSICSVSHLVLSYWWLAMLPILVVGTALTNWALFDRRAA